jgi:hypothetical protein
MCKERGIGRTGLNHVLARQSELEARPGGPLPDSEEAGRHVSHVFSLQSGLLSSFGLLGYHLHVLVSVSHHCSLPLSPGVECPSSFSTDCNTAICSFGIDPINASYLQQTPEPRV